MIFAEAQVELEQIMEAPKQRRVIIYAQGKGSRWRRDHDGELPCSHKQLLPLGDGVVLQRTIRQVRANGWNDITVVCEPDPFVFFTEGADIVTLREPTGPLLQGMYATRRLWNKMGEIVFLLGDVIYSNTDIEDILRDENELAVLGRLGGNKYTGKAACELFAVKLANIDTAHKEFLTMLAQLLVLEIGRENLKLWDIYDHILEFGMDMPMSACFVALDQSYTDDIDSPQEYHQFYSKLESLAVRDDETWRK